MVAPPRRHTHDLRKGRLSIPGAHYFITLCVHQRRVGINRPPIADALIDTLRRLHRDGDIYLSCATVMPDHLHYLAALGENLTLEQTQQKLKTLSKGALGMASLRWQRNFFDHRLRRPEKTMEDFARYIFMNPYRKALVSPEELWPWWVVNRHYRPAFLDALRGGAYPPPQWIGETPSARDLTSVHE